MSTATTTTSKMHHTALVQWYGSNRMLAEHVGRELRGCNWVCVPFAGGMSEVRRIDARTVLVNDLHRHVINLAIVVKDDAMRRELYHSLRRTAFHPDELKEAQMRCLALEESRDNLFSDSRGISWADHVQWATDYFICAWMTRAGSAGTPSEFTASPSIRFNAGGGDSCVRFRNAARSLIAWGRVFRRCNFTCSDAFDLLGHVKDSEDTGIYADAPWPDVGDGYTHGFSEGQQRRLAVALRAFRRTRVVVRYGDHPLIRELYPQDKWIWKRLSGRTQTNEASNEVLILNGLSRAGEVA